MGTGPNGPTEGAGGNYTAPNSPRLAYDVSLDGKRFLMIKNVEITDAEANVPRPQIVIVQNWVDELKRLVPTR